MVATGLHEQCSVAGKTGVEDLQSELEMTRSTPTERLWVHCFLIPTVGTRRVSGRLYLPIGSHFWAHGGVWKAVSSDQFHVSRHKEGVCEAVSTDQFTSIDTKRVFGRLYLLISLENICTFIMENPKVVLLA